jgi:hypothetical protein
MRLKSGGGAGPRRATIGGGYRYVLLGAGVVVLVLALAQLVLPKIAVQRVRDRVERYGHVSSVSVSAFPALKLLWGDMDRLDVRASSMRVGVTQIGGLVSSANASEDLNFSAAKTRLLASGLVGGGLQLTDVTLRKRGKTLSSQATIGEADLRAALPAGFEVQPLASGAGSVEVRASGSLFGVQASVDGVITATEGKLVVQPVGIPLGGLLKLTLFADPRIFIQGIGASSQRNGYRFTINARLQ